MSLFPTSRPFYPIYLFAMFRAHRQIRREPMRRRLAHSSSTFAPYILVPGPGHLFTPPPHAPCIPPCSYSTFTVPGRWLPSLPPLMRSNWRAVIETIDGHHGAAGGGGVRLQNAPDARFRRCPLPTSPNSRQPSPSRLS